MTTTRQSTECVLGQRLERTLRDHVSRPAVVDGAATWTFGQLGDLSDVIAGWLVASDNPSHRVVVLAERGLFAYASILGALRAGVAFVPLAPGDPLSRLRTMLDTIGPCPVLADGEGWAVLQRLLSADAAAEASIDEPLFGDPPGFGIASHAPGRAPSPIGPDSTNPSAYILFTSGSTGRPKGVPISRANLGAFWHGFEPLVRVGPADRVSQNFRLTFDLSIADLLMSWCTGAALVVARDADRSMPAAFIDRHRISVWFSVPSVADVMKQAGQLDHAAPGAHSPRLSMFCGERLLSASAQAWMRRFPGEMLNLYGPTEATIACSCQPVNDLACGGAVVPIGRTFGESVFALRPTGGGGGENGHELLIGGPQVFSGYLTPPAGEPPANPFDGVFYRSGDRATLDDGVYHFRGRLDDQVKVRGHRIELGEIECHIRALDGVRDAVVVCLNPADSARTQLVAVIAGHASAHRLLGARLAARLPAHMLPRCFVYVDALPRSANGKIDRAAAARLAGG